MTEEVLPKMHDVDYVNSEAGKAEIEAHYEKCVHNFGVLGRIAGSSPQLEINDFCFLFLYNIIIKQDIQATLDNAKKMLNAFNQTPSNEKFNSWNPIVTIFGVLPDLPLHEHQLLELTQLDKLMDSIVKHMPTEPAM